MDPIKTGHERPVNKQAALLLAKAPWWAAYPEPAKKAILPVAPTLSWSAILDYTKPPPDPFGKNDAMIDHRGEQIRMKDGAIATITGFSRSVTVFTPRLTRTRKGTSRAPSPRHREAMLYHFWWAECEGEMLEMSWKNHGRYLVERETRMIGIE